MTITEFLLARITEDEADAHHRAEMIAEVERLRQGATGGVVPDLVTPPRMLAECAAKRAIVENAEYWNDQEFGTITRGVSRDRLGEVLRVLAPVYADHPDYQPEWAL